MCEFHPEQLIVRHTGTTRSANKPHHPVFKKHRKKSPPPVSVLFLHLAASHATIDAFRSVFSTGLSLYPKKKGINLLHQKNEIGDSPYMVMCKTHEKKTTGDVIRVILQGYNTTPYDPVDALVYAATESNIRLDGVYLLLRTHPDVLQRLLCADTTITAAASSTAATAKSTTSCFILPESKMKYRKRKQ